MLSLTKDMTGRGDLYGTGMLVEDAIRNWAGVGRGRPNGRGSWGIRVGQNRTAFQALKGTAYFRVYLSK